MPLRVFFRWRNKRRYFLQQQSGKRLARHRWEHLITDLGSREMESGLVRLVGTLPHRMQRSIGGDLNRLIDYVLNNNAAWNFPLVANENPEDRKNAIANWERHVSFLDTAILSLIGENDISDEGIEGAIDDILQSSLWNRRILHRREQIQQALKAGLVSRCRFIWEQSTAPRRRGYFLAGVGLTTGQALDAIAEEVNPLLVQANAAILQDDAEMAITIITSIAEQVFTISPFIPDSIPENWRDILRTWLLGEPVANVSAGQEAETLQFIEGGVIYRLPWAIEAIRVRATANGDTIGDSDLPLESYELGIAVQAIETGTLNRSAAILIQAGFSSRIAAIKVIVDTSATFQNTRQFRQWLNSPEIVAMSEQPDWPTAETRAIWLEFAHNFIRHRDECWTNKQYQLNVAWLGPSPPSGTPVQIHEWNEQLCVLSADGTQLGRILTVINSSRTGLIRAQVALNDTIDITYLGPEDLFPPNTA